MKLGTVEKVKKFIECNNLVRSHEVVILGLSGGPDSVFLLHVLKSLEADYKLKLVAAHLDHEWRTDSHDDMLFCKAIAEKLGVEFVSCTASDLLSGMLAEKNYKYKGSQEELGRAVRRQFFSQLARTYNTQTVALGHHADDQIETFFIRLLRGAGITGLASIRPRSGLFIHPLLAVTKQEILDYLTTHALSFRTDPTNSSDLYLRNKIRNTVIPSLEATDNRFKNNLLRAVHNLQEADKFLEVIISRAYNSCTNTSISSDGTYRTVLCLKKMRALDGFLQKQVILKWLCTTKIPFTPSAGFFEEILRFLLSPRGGQHVISPSWKIIKKCQSAYLAYN